jgi:hypothetical protein
LATPKIASYVLELGRKRNLSFPAMAELVGKQFGGIGPTAPQIAAFLGRTLRGKSSLNRFGRDPELAAWLRQHSSAGRLSDVHTACIQALGPDRTPSRTGIAAFLHAAGRRGRHGDGGRLDRDPEVAAWLRAEAVGHTLDELCNACAGRYGHARTPSRSAVGRFLKAAGYQCPGHRSRLHRDPEVAEWLRERAPGRTMDELRLACADTFGAPRTPSRTAIHRYLSRLPGGKLTRRKCRIDRDSEVANWVAEHRDGITLDGLHAAALARFGVERSPSRSGLARFLSSTRTRWPV